MASLPEQDLSDVHTSLSETFPAVADIAIVEGALDNLPETTMTTTEEKKPRIVIVGDVEPNASEIIKQLSASGDMVFETPEEQPKPRKMVLGPLGLRPKGLIQPDEATETQSRRYQNRSKY